MTPPQQNVVIPPYQPGAAFALFVMNFSLYDGMTSADYHDKSCFYSFAIGERNIQRTVRREDQ